jgi:hypothetical protein
MIASSCTTTLPADCAPASCGWRCAVDVIDELLSQPGAASGEEADLLLDLRWKLGKSEDAAGALKLFCDLRRRMEHRHYLAFFRIRRWMENHLLAAVRICPAAEAHSVPVKLDHYCVEAIRRVCLCAALGRGAVMIAPRLEFLYRPSANRRVFAPLPSLAQNSTLQTAQTLH